MLRAVKNSLSWAKTYRNVSHQLLKLTLVIIWNRHHFRVSYLFIFTNLLNDRILTIKYQHCIPLKNVSTYSNKSKSPWGVYITPILYYDCNRKESRKIFADSKKKGLELRRCVWSSAARSVDECCNSDFQLTSQFFPCRQVEDVDKCRKLRVCLTPSRTAVNLSCTFSCWGDLHAGCLEPFTVWWRCCWYLWSEQVK